MGAAVWTIGGLDNSFIVEKEKGVNSFIKSVKKKCKKCKQFCNWECFAVFEFVFIEAK